MVAEEEKEKELPRGREIAIIEQPETKPVVNPVVPGGVADGGKAKPADTKKG